MLESEWCLCIETGDEGDKGCTKETSGQWPCPSDGMLDRLGSAC